MADKKKVRFGLLPKLLLGVFIPILVAFFIIGSLVLYSWNIGEFKFTSIKDIGYESFKELSAASVMESKSSLDKMGEKMIREKAIDVAGQVEVFIKSRPPKMKKEEILRAPQLKEIAVQKVGLTGYTALYELPDAEGVWRTWAHVNPKIIGIDMSKLSEPLGKNFPGFWKIFAGVVGGKESRGYYTWQEADKTFREKYMVCTPVKGTPYIIASTTYIDEFSKPSKAIEVKMKDIERRYLEEYENRTKIFYAVILCVILILLVRIFFYARSVIKPILQLAEVADKISMGELNTPIQVKAKGEVAILAESIERMQTSVIAAIERLQKRKESKT
ncbi:MAG: HAMP domain-containing protein [Deltaproteobacteria bacterium]|nr:HAMP domain-containing protein [Deltaproteobacteria bacterium]